MSLPQRHRNRRLLAAIGSLAATAAATAGPDGLYVKGSAMYIDRFDGIFSDSSGAIDALITGDLSGDGDTEFDEGAGFTAGLGFKFEPIGIAVELEYIYTSNDVDTVGGAVSAFQADGDYESHLVSLNALIDAENVIGPLGFYVGAGIGVSYADFDVREIAGTDVGGVLRGDSSTDFAWQIFGGVTFSLFDSAQLYAGVRYMNTSEVDLGGVIGESDSLAVEVGLRLYF
ncbi:MAG: outer membrane protein [Phycisphaerales bacterium]